MTHLNLSPCLIWMSTGPVLKGFSSPWCWWTSMHRVTLQGMGNKLSYAKTQQTAVHLWFWWAIKLDKQKLTIRREERMCLYTFPPVNRERQNFGSHPSSFPRLSLLLPVIQCVTIQTPHSVTVSALTGSLGCLVIQLKQWHPKNPQCISIIVLTECRDAAPHRNIPTPHVICMSITSQNRHSQCEARRANLKLHCTSNAPISQHADPRTSPKQSLALQRKLEREVFWVTGSRIMKARCVL